MRKMVLVTPWASSQVLLKYLDLEIIGLEEGIDIAKGVGAKLTLAISSFKTISIGHLLSFVPKDKIVKYQEDENEEKTMMKIIDFLFSQGAEEIIVLDKMAGKFTHIHSLLLVMKNSKGFVQVQNDSNLISYYGKGNHVITKQNFDLISIIGFPYAIISMEHVSKPVRGMKLAFADDNAFQNTLLERIAVLKVEEGGVLLVLSKDQ